MNLKPIHGAKMMAGRIDIIR